MIEGKVYGSLNQIIIEATAYIPEELAHFTAITLNPPRTFIINYKEKNVNTIKQRYALDGLSEYYELIQHFSRYLKWEFNNDSIYPYHYNRIIHLSVVIPYVVRFLREREADISVFRTSQYFLRYAIKRDIPLVYFPYLAALLVIRDFQIEIEKMRESKRKEDLMARADKMNRIFWRAYPRLRSFVSIISTKTTLKVKESRPDQVYIYRGKGRKLKLFEGNNARNILLVGDRGVGKTIALLRITQALLNQGYTVIVFGEDTRKEFRFASFPLTVKSNRSLYDYLKKSQQEEPDGLPVTIFTTNPKYPIERHISEFTGTQEEWNSLNGVIVFEVEIPRLLKSFEDWRSRDRTKKIAICLNEAQRFIGSIGTKGEWLVFHSAEKFFTNLRGYGVPSILNTQFLTKIKKDSRMVDEVFASTTTDEDDRKKIASLFNKKDVKYILADRKLKENKEFIRITGDTIQRIKFLACGCMPETSYQPLEKLFELREVGVIG